MIASAEGTGANIYPRNEPLNRIQFKSINQHLRHLIKSGLPYARAVTRLMSDTPPQILKRSQQGERGDGIIQREMTRLREQGIQYGRAATLSVDSNRLPACQIKTTVNKQEKVEDTSQEVDSKVPNGEEPENGTDKTWGRK